MLFLSAWAIQLGQRLKFAVLAVACCFLGVSPAAAVLQPGVDVSHYQGSINWTSVKNAGYSFSWAKATEGTYGHDDTFVNNENNGKGAGVLIGAYHFARPDLTSPSAESSYFWNFAGNYVTGDG